MPIAHVKDIDLYYEEYGSGGNYLLSACQFHSSVESYTIDLAKHGFHVFNVQLRGYGRSTPVHPDQDLGDYWYETWADDVCDFADAMGIDKFFYTAESHGSGVGWLICVRHPQRVRAFFSVVGGPHSKDGQETSAARLKTIEAGKSDDTWRPYAKRKADIAQPCSLEDDSPEAHDLQRRRHEEEFRFWMDMPYDQRILNPKKPFPLVKTEEELIKVLRQVKLPVLHIGGMQDTICKPENIIRSCRAVEGSKMVIYQDCGHFVARMRKNEVVRDILTFCEERGLL